MKEADVELIKIKDVFKKFSCQRETDLEDFLLHRAIEYQNIEYGKTFLLIDKNEISEGNIEVIAFFTIGTTALDISCLSVKQKRKIIGNLPGRDRLDYISAYLIGQLGRNDKYSKEDMPGEIILYECYNQLKMAQAIVGGKLIILECRDALCNFYESKGFSELSTASKENLHTYYKKFNF